MNKSPVPDLSVTIAGIKMTNPVMTASGTFGYGKEYAELLDLNQLGALITKGISLKPMAGNPPPRICETPSGMLNAIGLQNVGVKGFIQDKLPFLSQLRIPVIVNILGHSLREYQEVAKHLNGRPGIAALEVNISCPNVSRGGMAFGSQPRNGGQGHLQSPPGNPSATGGQVDASGNGYWGHCQGRRMCRGRRCFLNQYHPGHGCGY